MNRSTRALLERVPVKNIDDVVDLILAAAQVRSFIITLFGFMIMLVALIVLLVVPYTVKAPAEVIALLSAATGSLGTILTQQNGYFFARHRQQGITDGAGNGGDAPPAPAVQAAAPKPATE
jgi:hypothetical protein